MSAARRGDTRLHKRIAAGLYFGGIVLAGLFTFVPGRIMHAVVFTGVEWPAALAAAVIGSILVAIVLRRRRGRLIAR
jgi:membrane associated rhomboid family serine protease